MQRKSMKMTWGILIEYYRAEKAAKTQDHSWQIKHFLIDDGDRICSEQTYRKMKLGEANFYAETYNRLIHKLGFEMTELKIAEVQLLDRLFEDLLQAVEFGKHELLKNLTNRILGMLEPYQDYFLYGEYYEVITIIQDHYLMSKLMNQAQYEKYQSIFPIFITPIRTIVKELLYRYCHVTFMETQKLNVLSERIQLMAETSDLLRSDQVLQLLFNRRIIKSYEMCMELRESLIKKQNHNLLTSIDMVLVSLCLNVKPKDLIIYLEELETLLELPDSGFSNHKKGKCYYTLAMQHFYQKRYDRAYEMYLKSISLDNNNIQEAAIYMRYIMDRLDVPRINFALYPISQCSVRFQTLYRYYQIRDELKIINLHDSKEISYKHLKILETYILDQIMPYMNGNNELLYEMFQEELDQIADRTQEYRAAQRFSIEYNKLRLVL